MKKPVTITGIDQVKKAFGDDVFGRAEASTVNKLAALGKTAISKSVRSYWNIKQKRFNEDSKAVRTSFRARKKIAYIKFTGKRLGLQEFPFKVRKAGKNKGQVSVQLHNKKSGYGALVLRHAWVKDWGNGDRIFDRNNKSGRPKRRQAPSLPHMVENNESGRDDVQAIISKITQRRSESIFNNELDFFMNKALQSKV